MANFKVNKGKIILSRPFEGKIILSRPFGGWISTLSGVNTTTGPSAALEGKEGQYTYSVAISLNRLEKYGHIAPGEVFSALPDTNSYILAVAVNGATCSNSNSFIILQNGSVIETDTSVNYSSAPITSFSPTPHGANSLVSTVNSDLIVMKDAATNLNSQGVSSPNEYVIATWEDNGTTADAMVLKVSSTGDVTAKKSDWFSGGVSANYLIALVPHKMCQSMRGDVYITNGQYIASAVMAAGVSLGAATRTNQDLNLGSGWIANGICSYKNFIAVIGHNKAASFASASSNLFRGECRVWLWDGFLIGGANFVYDIPDNYGNGIYFDGKDLYALTNGRNNSSKIWKFNGNGFTLIAESGFIAPGFSPLQGNFEYYNDSLHIGTFNNSNAHLFQLINGGLHDRTIIKNGTTAMTSIGMVKNLYQNVLYIGTSEGTLSNGIGTTPFRIMYSASFTTGYLNSIFRTRLFELPYQSDLTKIKIYFSQFGSGASLQIGLYRDYSAGNPSGGTDLLNKTITFGQLGAVSSWSMPLTIPNVNSFYMDFKFNHTSTSATFAIIKKVEIEYTPGDDV